MCFKINSDWFLLGSNDGWVEIKTEYQAESGNGGLLTPVVWLNDFMDG